MSVYVRTSIKQFFITTVITAITFVAGGSVVSYFLQIPNDFHYSADILSLDNFYDETEQKFSGEQRSVTTFVYRLDERAEDHFLIRNIFDVRTVTGEQIINIERDYAINPKTWMHVSHRGDIARSGYLFGPHKVSKDDTFTYWHVNYDTPIEMVFSGEEVLNGLLTYRFTSNFGVDQTESLTHLPGVPEERGVNLDGSLSLWIEPFSGWLVKYSDQAIAYYYDQETQTRIHPWNKFKNNYTHASVREQVAHAKTLRFYGVIFHFVIPLLVFITGIIVIMWRRFSWRLGVPLIIITLLTGSALFLKTSFFEVKEEPIHIGISRWVPLGNHVYDENIQGFKDALTESGYQEGVDVIYTDKTANALSDQQIEIARSFILDDVDLVYSLTTPGTQILQKRITNRPIVFSIVTYPVEAGIVASLEHSENNLVGTRNWVPIERQLNVFRQIVPTFSTLGFVHRTGELNSEVQKGEMETVAEDLGIRIVDISASNLNELVEILEMTTEIDALFSACDTLVQGEAEEIIATFVAKRAIPSFSCNKSGVEKNDLVGVVADFYQIGNLAGEKAALILEGATPTSLVTTTVTRPFVYLNKRRADELGITFPQSILLEAKGIIQ